MPISDEVFAELRVVIRTAAQQRPPLRKVIESSSWTKERFFPSEGANADQWAAEVVDILKRDPAPLGTELFWSELKDAQVKLLQERITKLQSRIEPLTQTPGASGDEQPRATTSSPSLSPREPHPETERPGKATQEQAGDVRANDQEPTTQGGKETVSSSASKELTITATEEKQYGQSRKRSIHISGNGRYVLGALLIAAVLAGIYFISKTPSAPIA